ncbi:MAG: transcriptional regulator [Muribaculaceae bacterium]|nr:transcriptional regulator [Muribaculaceae bacterium]
MKELDPLLHSQLRLAVMSILMNLEEADFVYIRQQTNSTAGNLSVQIDKLAAAGYIMVDRSIVHRRSRTTCRVTPQGRQAFERYVAAIKEYLNI